MSEIPVKRHGEEPQAHDFLKEAETNVWNYTETNEKLSLRAGSGASWMKKWKEKLGPACHLWMLYNTIMMRDAWECPFVGKSTLPSSLRVNYKIFLKQWDWFYFHCILMWQCDAK